MKKIILTVIILLLIIFSVTLKACTVFNSTKDGVTLVGRNMDWYTYENYIAFLPHEDGKYGRVYFGWNEFPSWYQGGMNGMGVMFAYLAAPYLQVTNSLQKPTYRGNYGNLMEKCMEECSSVDEVLEVFGQYNLRFLENCHVMVVDRNGNSVIIGGDDYTIKNGVFQVVTNFRPTHLSLGGFPCWRYNKAYKMLEEMTNLSVDYFTQMLDETHNEGSYPTQWSIVYDLYEYDINLYHYHNFDKVITFNLHEELEKGEHIYSIPSLFNSSNNEPPNPPEISGPTLGKAGREYSYNFKAIDPNGDNVYYWILWFEGCSGVSWDGPYNSGEEIIKSYLWEIEGNYTIKVKAKDIYGAESNWASLEISMPKQKNYDNFPRILLMLLEHFPFLKPHFLKNNLQ